MGKDRKRPDDDFKEPSDQLSRDLARLLLEQSAKSEIEGAMDAAFEERVVVTHDEIVEILRERRKKKPPK